MSRKKILIIDELVVARSFMNSLIRNLEYVVIDTHTNFNFDLINDAYDLVITDPRIFDIEPRGNKDLYLDTLKRLQSNGAHLWFISTKQKSWIDHFIGKIKGEHSYALKPLNTYLLIKYAGKFLGVASMLDQRIEIILNYSCIGPVFND